jgi:peptide/nickel transport system substrate-binding protein
MPLNDLSRRSFLTAIGSLPLLSILPHVARADGGMLRVGLSGFTSDFNPFLQIGAPVTTMRLLVHRGLFGYGPDGALRGELAQKWSNDGANRWTVVLRDAWFHDGSPVTSKDVAYTIAHIAAPDTPASMKAQMQAILSVETPDDKTVVLNTSAPVVMLPYWFASNNLPIIRKDSLDQKGGIGAGPFIMGNVERGQSAEFSALDRFYRKGLPAAPGLKCIAYADENLRVAAVEARDVDIIEYVPWQSMDTIAGNNRLVLDATDGPFMYLTFNFTKPPFDNPLVRRAIGHALRREEIVSAVFFGKGSVLDGFPLQKESFYFEANAEHGWAYDPEKARALLKQAGYAQGFSCNLLATAQFGMHKSTAEVIQQQLAEIGILANLNLPDWTTRVTLGTRGQYDMAVQGVGWDNADPDSFSTLCDPSLGNSILRSFGFKSAELTDLCAKGRAEFDEGKRKDIYSRLQGTTIEQAPFISLNWRSQAFAYGKNVAGFKNLPGALTFYSGTVLEQTHLA